MGAGGLSDNPLVTCQCPYQSPIVLMQVNPVNYYLIVENQFCHGFLSKDLNLTQEKVIQAMGRIGRNNIQQTYTVRFRDDAQIEKLFTSDTEKPEVINMNVLFNYHSVKYENGEYIELPEENIDDIIVDDFEEEYNPYNEEYA